MSGNTLTGNHAGSTRDYNIISPYFVSNEKNPDHVFVPTSDDPDLSWDIPCPDKQKLQERKRRKNREGREREGGRRKELKLTKTSCHFAIINETLKWLSSLPTLMQKSHSW